MGSLKCIFALKWTVTALHMFKLTYHKDSPDLFKVFSEWRRILLVSFSWKPDEPDGHLWQGSLEYLAKKDFASSQSLPKSICQDMEAWATLGASELAWFWTISLKMWQKEVLKSQKLVKKILILKTKNEVFWLNEASNRILLICDPR